MENENLTKLRQQIENLMYDRSRLLDENNLLSKKLVKIVQERGQLLSNKEKMTQKLNNIINRLKAGLHDG